MFCQVIIPPLSSLNNRNSAQPTFYDIKAAAFDTFSVNSSTIQAIMKFEIIIPDDRSEFSYVEVIILDKILVEDRKGNSWEHCNKNVAVGPKEESLILTNERCQ
ncbi:PREDICTED: uncharacterized protein LOC105363070 [Ceratosolen solmsi marchali]|uniref:Uncharacterized protein LOC105363070 n=1 Tax=Ceratosolen solmsi marchali TaxID=326594 RepID=A0AAJ6YIZ9_9HYME|nr:PREDICTED: uncharacterized protein LOC105363070 [Ceratosolen solmsi marchali]